MMRTIYRRAAIALWAVNAGLALAAQGVMTPEAIPLIQYAYAIGLALVGGAASSLSRYAGGATTATWKIELARDFVCSALAGVLVLLGSLHFGTPPLLAAIAIALAGWGGARTLEWAYQRFQKRGEALIDPPAESKP